MDNHIGETYGEWTVIEKIGSDYIGECSCGTKRKVYIHNMKRGLSTNCGCKQRQKISESRTIHGCTHTKLYNVWSGIKRRCYNKNQKSYVDYGARGIEMCQEWRNDFVVFKDWAMSNGYIEGKVEIDRINFNGNYEPNNCRWITKQENQNNKRNNKHIEINGETKTFSQWAKEYGLKPGLVRERVIRGETGCAIIAPVPSKEDFLSKKIEFKGRIVTYKQLSDEFCISKEVIGDRYRKGLRDDDLIQPLNPKNIPIPIEQYTLDGVFIREYESSKEAQKITGIQSANIRKCCAGQRNMAGGYIWKIK